MKLSNNRYTNKSGIELDIFTHYFVSKLYDLMLLSTQGAICLI